MLVKPLQPSNAVSSILVTPAGIIILVKPLHSQNALPFILVTLSGIVTLVKPLHPQNAKNPILVTPSGIITLVKLLYFLNASVPISVTFLPSISPGITSSVLSPVYPVMVIPFSLSSYVKSSYDSACAVIPSPPHSNTHKINPRPA